MKKNWIPIDEFIQIIKDKYDIIITPRSIHDRIDKRRWYNGYVVKKCHREWAYGCVADFEHFIKNKKYNKY